MKRLISHIEYLLQSHDCVIVPGIGAFLMHGISAYYSDDESVWYPPRGVVSFNPELSRTDGLLAASIARREEISIDAASRAVADGVAEMKYVLESTRNLRLSEIGALSIDEDGYLNFQPGSCAWLTPSLMWLPHFAMPVLPGASQREAAKGNEQRRALLPVQLMRVAQIAACACLFIVLGWVVMKNLTYSPENQFATIGPVETMRSASVPVSMGETSDKPARLILASAPENEIIENIVVKPETPAPTDKYYVIVASLATRAEADKYLSQNKDLNLGILEKDGRFRIYAASGKEITDATASFRKSDAASRYTDFWVCRR